MRDEKPVTTWLDKAKHLESITHLLSTLSGVTCIVAMMGICTDMIATMALFNFKATMEQLALYGDSKLLNLAMMTLSLFTVMMCKMKENKIVSEAVERQVNRTFFELWKKNEHLLCPQVNQDITQLVQQWQNGMMPELSQLLQYTQELMEKEEMQGASSKVNAYIHSIKQFYPQQESENTKDKTKNKAHKYAQWL